MDFIHHFNTSQPSSLLSVFEQHQQPPWMFTPKPRDLRPPLIPHKHLIPGFLLIHLLILISPNAPSLRKFAAPIVLGVIMYPMNVVASQNWAVAFLSGCILFYQVLVAVNYLLVVDIYTDKRFRLDNDDRDPAQLGLWERNKWVTKLCMTARGVGFRFRPRGVAEPVDMSRGQFFTMVLMRIVYCYFLMDFFTFIVQYDPFFMSQGCWKGVSPFVAVPSSVQKLGVFDSQCFPPIVSEAIPAKVAWILVRHACISAEVYSLLTSMYDVCALVAVCLLRIDEPKNWPTLFGSIASVFHGRGAGLRGFWGRFWHQSFRLHFALPSEAIIRFLGLIDPKPAAAAQQNGTTTPNGAAAEKQDPAELKKLATRRWLRNNIMAMTAYANSGLLHFIGCVTLGIPGYGSFAFFSLQFLGTFIEDHFLPRNTFVRVMWFLVFAQLTSPFFYVDLLNGSPNDGSGWNPPFSLWKLIATGDVNQMYQWGNTANWVRWDPAGSLWGYGIAV